MSNPRSRTSSQNNSQIDIIFYDGICGLCHHFVKFVLAHRHPSYIFYFAPQQGLTFQAIKASRQDIIVKQDSIVVLTKERQFLIYSDAILYVCARLTGIWPTLEKVGKFLPKVLRDTLYKMISHVRARLFEPPKALCPTDIPAEWKQLFLD
ncbi:MAG: hypothetical protein K0S74_1435 [Chlamydiales bacterium]|jgi:predicted DCC family thiol-disulfide oxidoreductase YuxK|nr:hypothetical protein [Chlamydiales bacterium]